MISKKAIGIVSLLGAGLLLEGRREIKLLKKTKYIIKNKNVPKALSGKTIVMFSDYHNSARFISNKRIMDIIESADPEFVIAAGDMLVGNNKDTVTAHKLLGDISAKYDVYVAPGNHERKLSLHGDDYKDALQMFKHNLPKNVYYLEDDKKEIYIDDQRIDIYGIDIALAFYNRSKNKKMGTDYIEKKIGKASEDAYNLLIAHNPEYFKTYAAWGADICFSGHYHGGIVRIPKLGGVISPRIVLFPEYDKGIYREMDSTMVLSSGIGQHSINLRINNIPEICIIKFKSTQNDK